ncbi:MAG: CPCC family cysteine-rich protein [Subdoligranulum sp.]|nr:CPCC family cysteine-rich protein [Subdoligranulum sp.]MDY6126600.1 CPCC family cysteine-rich protein [Gemmiger qucibialis]
MSSTEIKCPCCGKAYVEEYAICPVCNWENDPVQARNPSTVRGANKMTLDEAKAAFAAGKAVE